MCGIDNMFVCEEYERELCVVKNGYMCVVFVRSIYVGCEVCMVQGVLYVFLVLWYSIYDVCVV